MWKLRISGPDDQPSSFDLKEKSLSLGRSSENDLSYPHDPWLSRRHLQFEKQHDDTWCVRDCDTRNGTVINSKKLKAAEAIKAGDRISAGHLTIEVLDHDQTRSDNTLGIRRDVDNSELSGLMTSLEMTLGEEDACLRHSDDAKIFISSTFADLKDYRQAVFEAIVGSGLSSENMIFWSADERSPLQVSLDRVRQSDGLILIVAHRYGYVPDGSTYSITEQEYSAAREAGIPVFAFLIDDELPWPPQHID